MRSLGRLTREYRAETRADVTTPRSVFSHYHVPRGTRVYKATRRHPGSANRAPSPTALSVTDKSLSLVYILLYTLDNYNTVSLPPDPLCLPYPRVNEAPALILFLLPITFLRLSPRGMPCEPVSEHLRRVGLHRILGFSAPSYCRLII